MLDGDSFALLELDLVVEPLHVGLWDGDESEYKFEIFYQRFDLTANSVFRWSSLTEGDEGFCWSKWLDIFCLYLKLLAEFK